MSILPDFMIRMIKLQGDDPDVAGPRRIVEPFYERTKLNGMTFGLSFAGYDIRTQQGFSFKPGSFRLLSSVEHFHMPNDVIGFVHDKSTWARQGIAVQNTVIEPGWRGFLTLEVTNHGMHMVTVREGDPIAQIVFHKMAARPQMTYAGKYQDQPEYPVAAILEPSS